MSVEAWTWTIVILSFALYLGIGYWARVRETAGFYVAGRGVPPVANGAATAADWMSGASYISMAGLISFLGFDGAVYLMGWTGGTCSSPSSSPPTSGSLAVTPCPSSSGTGTTPTWPGWWR